MRRGSLSAGALCFFVLVGLVSGACWAVDAPVTDDTFTDNLQQTVNFGSNGTLLVITLRGITWLKFDLSTLPPGTVGSDVAVATLKVWVNRAITFGSMFVFQVDGPWDESTITAATTAPYAISRGTLTATRENAFAVADITALVRDWIDGVVANEGVAVQEGIDPVIVRFDSKENTGTGHEPELEITLN